MDSKSFELQTDGNIRITVNDAKGVSFDHFGNFIQSKCIW